MGFVYSECAFVETLLHPKAQSSECPSLGPDSCTAEGDYFEMEAGAGWTQCSLSLKKAWDLNIKSTAGFGSS